MCIPEITYSKRFEKFFDRHLLWLPALPYNSTTVLEAQYTQFKGTKDSDTKLWNNKLTWSKIGIVICVFPKIEKQRQLFPTDILNILNTRIAAGVPLHELSYSWSYTLT